MSERFQYSRDGGLTWITSNPDCIIRDVQGTIQLRYFSASTRAPAAQSEQIKPWRERVNLYDYHESRRMMASLDAAEAEIADLRAELARRAPSAPSTRAVEKEAELWRALSRDTSTIPCEYPCLRDDLADWLANQAEAPVQPIQQHSGNPASTGRGAGPETTAGSAETRMDTGFEGGPKSVAAPELDVEAEFDAFWQREVANNGGVGFGADYKRWARKGFFAARTAATSTQAARAPGEWIDLKHEKPRDWQQVLVALDNGTVTVGMRGSMGWHWSETDAPEDAEATATHWQPWPVAPSPHSPVGAGD